MNQRHVLTALAACALVIAAFAIALLPGGSSVAADDVVSHAGIPASVRPGPTWSAVTQ